MAQLSHTEENYLKAIFHHTSDGENVSTNTLAATMQTTAASTNDMMKRLTSKGLITHVKYKGASITTTGKKVALQVIRKHRLWEVFLVEKLNFQWDEVHEIAEQLEHIHSPILTDRLDDFLGNPKLDPHGDPIPDRHGNMLEDKSVPLSKLKVGDVGIITCVANDESALLQHLDSLSLRPGVQLKILNQIAFDQSFEIRTKSKDKVFISSKVAELLLVLKEEQK